MSTSKTPASMVVETDTKALPLQKRSRQTYDRILSVAGALLEEVGMERISTNLVAERAGVTAAALYRYFPNKYAIVVALAEKAARISDVAVAAWIERGGLDTDSLEAAVANNFAIQTEVIAILRDLPGGPWVARAMRALPVLRDVAIRARQDVVDQLYAFQRQHYLHVPEAELRTAILVSTEMFSTNQLLVLEDATLNADVVIHEACLMAALYYEHLDARFRPGGAS